jgi:NADPH:quinone reductase-like Zn-dependent oxidoreductase
MALGAVHAINYRTTDFVAAVHAQTAGRGVDLILDIMGGSYVPRNLAALAVDGRLVQIGLLEGEPVASVDLAPHPRAPSHADGLDAAGAHRRREGAHRRRAAPRGLAARGRRPGETARGGDVSAGRGRGRAPS